MAWRPLTDKEEELAESIFGDSIDYDLVRVHNVKVYDNPLLPDDWNQGDDEAVTPDGEIYFPPGYYLSDFANPDGNGDPQVDGNTAWFIHEMSHVMQHQQGMNVKEEKIRDVALLDDKYDYNDIFHGKQFADLPMEAQAEFLEDMFRKQQGLPVDRDKDNDGINEVEDKSLNDYLAQLPAGLPGGNPENGSLDDLDKPLIRFPVPDLPSFMPQAKAPFDAAPDTGSPLVLDLDGDGIELTTFSASTTETFFDIDGDNFAEQTAWITANQDGLLVRDLNENGQIDGVEELFGSPSIDGFALLATLDDNGDHLIDQYDEAFADLLVWKDVNGDSMTQDGELLTLSGLSIVSFDLAGVAASTSTVSGNSISHASTYKLANGTTRSIVDAWFTHDNVNTIYTGQEPLDVRTMFLPTLRGFGKLPDLHVAMSQDEDLLLMIEDLVSGFSFDTFDPANGWNEAVTDILYRWAGVESVDPNSRGSWVNGQRLEFLEEFFGEEFSQGGMSNPLVNAGILLDQSWTILFETMRAQLLLQSGANELFADGVVYNPVTGEIEGDLALSQVAIIDLEDFATDTGVDTEEFWIEVARFLDATKGFENLTGTENGWMNTSIVATDAGLTWTGIKALVDIDNGGATINGTSGADTLTGTAHGEIINGNDGADTLNAVAGDDELHGGTGNDILNGGADQDTLYGDGDNDTLDGGSGGDIVYGGYGNDTYVYASGDDVYYDANGTDTVLLPSGITSGDVTFYRVVDDAQTVNSLFVAVDGLGTIEFVSHFNSGGVITANIETLTFADTSTFNLGTLATLTTYGGESDDVIVGGTVSRADTMYGYGGNDTLTGNSGNDTLDGGVGNDLLQGYEGDDTYIASPGFDTIMENGGTDVIVLPASVTAGDVHFLRLNSLPYDLQINVDGLGQIVIDNQFFSLSGARVETLQFSSSSLTLTSLTIETIGTSGNDSMDGITAGASTNDIFDGREGNDTMAGAAGSDIYYFSQGQDVVNESTGSSNDGIKFHEGYSPGDITLYRGGYQGRDLIFADTNGNTLTASGHFYNTQLLMEYAQFFGGTTWTFSTMEIETRGTSGNDVLFDYSIGDASTDDTIYGYAGNDQLHGGEGNNEIHGGDGTDTIYGGSGIDLLYGDDGADYLDSSGGNDTLVGGAGADDLRSGANDDLLEGGSGNDAMRAGSGTDTVTYLHAAAGVTLNLTSGASNDGDGGADTYNLADIENATGSLYADSMTGSGSDNILRGLDGDDTITGGSGNDTLYGDAGADTLSGGNNNDILYGGAGLDSLTGGANADTFVFELLSAFSNQDTITDFTGSSDKIDIHDVIDVEFDPVTETIAQFVDFTNSSGNSIMSIDRDGAGTTYGFVNVATLTGVINLDETTLYNNGYLLAA